MKKIFLLSLLVAFSLSATPSDSIGTAPFKEEQDIKLNEYKPVVKGNAVFYGTRKLEFLDDGKIACTQDGTPVFTIITYYSERRDNKFHAAFSTSDKKNNRFKTTPVEFSENTFTQRLEYSHEGNSGEFIQTGTLLADGRIKIEQKLTLPEELRTRVLDDSIFFNFPADHIYGSDIVMTKKDGETESFSVPETENIPVKSDWRMLVSKFTFFRDYKKFAFSVEPLVADWWTVRNYQQRTTLRLFPAIKSPDKTISCIIDLRNAPHSENKPTQAGLDFKKLENIRTFDTRLTRNMMPNPSFEQGDGGHARIVYPGFAYGEKKWQSNVFSVDSENALDGNFSLRINTFCKSRGPDWRGIFEAGDVTLLPVLVEPGNYVFSYWVKGNRPGQTISAWASRTSLPVEKEVPPDQRGDRWMRLAGKIDDVTDQWTRFDFPVKVLIDQPLNFSFNAVSPTEDGSVWIDCIQLERGDKVSSWQGRPVESRLITNAKGNFLEYGAKNFVELQVMASEPGQAETQVIDFYDNVIWSNKFSFAKGTKKIAIDHEFPRGVFVVRTEYTFENNIVTWDAHRFSVMSFLDNKHKHKNLFCIDYSSNLPSRSDFEMLLERSRKIGFGSKSWFHQNFKEVADKYQAYDMDISHGYICERSRAKKHYRVYAETAKAGRRELSNDMPLIDDWRAESGENSDVSEEYLLRFKEAVKTRAANHPWCRRWSFLGEDDAFAPMLAGVAASEKSFRNYVKLHLAFRDAIKELDPSLQVIGGQIPCNTWPTGVDAIERFLKTAAELGGGKYDCFSIHTYRYRPENPELDSDIAKLRKVMKAYGYGDDTMLMFTEGGNYNLYHVPEWKLEISMWDSVHSWLYGAVSYEMGWNEKVVAGLYARQWLAMLKYPNSSFGCIGATSGQVFDMDIALTPFAGQKAVNTMGRLLGEAAFVKDIRFAPYVRCYVFEDASGRPVAAVWSYEPKLEKGYIDAMVADADFGDMEPEIFDLMENLRSNSYSKTGRLRFAVSSFPMFIRGKSGETAAFVKALGGAKVVEGDTIPPIAISMTPSSAAEMNLNVVNSVDTDYSGVLAVNGVRHDLKLLPQEHIKITLPLPKKLEYERMINEEMQVSVDDKHTLNLSFEGILCKHVDGKPDWAEIPPVRFERGKNIDDEDNLSGTYQLAWNSEYLFIRVNVTDDKFVHEEYSRNETRWNNDSLQIYFDTLSNGRLKPAEAGYDNDDYDYAVFPNSEGTSARVWRSLQPDIQFTLGTATPPSKVFADDIPAEFSKVNNGYVYEVAFPAQYLLPARLVDGASFGFALFVNDRDDDKNVHAYLTLATDGRGCYNRPAVWPVILLCK